MAGAAVNAGGWPDCPVASVRPPPARSTSTRARRCTAPAWGTASLCPLPTCLLQAGCAQHPDLLDLDKLDKQLQHRADPDANYPCPRRDPACRTVDPRPPGHSNGTG
jgi:hypothetical protein